MLQVEMSSARGPWQSQSPIKFWSLYAISRQKNITSDYSSREHDRKWELVIEILMRCWTQNTVAARRVPAYTSAINERGLGHINIVAGDNVSRVAINDVALPLTNYVSSPSRLCWDYKSKLCHISHLKSAFISTNIADALTSLAISRSYSENPFKVQLLQLV